MQSGQNYFKRLFVTILAGTLLSACNGVRSEQTTPTITPSIKLPSLLGNETDLAEVPPPPPLNLELVAEGQTLYNQYCAECHGANGEGHSNWKEPNEDGSYNPPPHDATGHTWHHSDDQLVTLIARGSSFPQSQMPTFEDQLSDDEIMAILEYLKTWWGPEERAFQWQVTWQERQRKEK